MPKYKINKYIVILTGSFLVVLLLFNITFNKSTVQKETDKFHNEDFYLTDSPLLSSGGNEFISIWDTTRISEGSTNNSQISLPLESSGTYDFTVEWGDGNSSSITSWSQFDITHNYSIPGIYNVNITGTIKGWRFNNGGDKLKLLEIMQWGCLQLGNSGSYFFGCENLYLSATDKLNLSSTSNLQSTFRECSNLGSEGNINNWDVSNVTDMSRMFEASSSFDQPIGSWNVSNVRNMDSMFKGAIKFDQPIGNWDVSSVTNMRSMFEGKAWFLSSFNQDLSDWNVSEVRDMRLMFCWATSFNHCISNWDVSSVKDMVEMFLAAGSFNQPIGNWDVSCVTNMYGMFLLASSFNQPIGNWNVSKVTDMGWMFSYAISFNQPLGTWNVSKVVNMVEMFTGVILSVSNYDNLLIGWSKLSLQNGITFGGGNSRYSSVAIEARERIIDTFNWTISDGGLEPETGIYGYDIGLISAVLTITVILVITKIKFRNK